MLLDITIAHSLRYNHKMVVWWLVDFGKLNKPDLMVIYYTLFCGHTENRISTFFESLEKRFIHWVSLLFKYLFGPKTMHD